MVLLVNKKKGQICTVCLLVEKMHKFRLTKEKKKQYTNFGLQIRKGMKRTIHKFCWTRWKKTIKKTRCRPREGTREGVPVQRLHSSSTGAVQGSQVMPLNLPSHIISQGGKDCLCGAGRQLHPDYTSHPSVTQCGHTVATSPQPQPSPAHPSLARGGQ